MTQLQSSQAGETIVTYIVEDCGCIKVQRSDPPQNFVKAQLPTICCLLNVWLFGYYDVLIAVQLVLRVLKSNVARSIYATYKAAFQHQGCRKSHSWQAHLINRCLTALGGVQMGVRGSKMPSARPECSPPPVIIRDSDCRAPGSKPWKDPVSHSPGRGMSRSSAGTSLWYVLCTYLTQLHPMNASNLAEFIQYIGGGRLNRSTALGTAKRTTIIGHRGRSMEVGRG